MICYFIICSYNYYSFNLSTLLSINSLYLSMPNCKILLFFVAKSWFFNILFTIYSSFSSFICFKNISSTISKFLYFPLLKSFVNIFSRASFFIILRFPVCLFGLSYILFFYSSSYCFYFSNICKASFFINFQAWKLF